MIPKERLEFSPIEGRPPLRLPDGLRMVVCLYEESAERPKIMAIACHPYLSGVPHRIRHVERAYEAILGRKGVVAWDGAHILDWYLGQRPRR